MQRSKIIFFLIFIVFQSLYSQSIYKFPEGKTSDKIRFELINNVMLIPVEVNGLELTFLLDTGVSKPIVFNFLKAADSLQILNAEKIQVRGLGDGSDLEALRSSHNTFKIGEAVNNDQAFYAVFDPELNFAPKIGKPIDGIIGYDIFKDFVVEINYNRKFIKIKKPKDYSLKVCNRCEVLDLNFEYNRPYILSNVDIGIKENIPVNLLLDSGSSDALWLFEDEEKDIKISQKSFIDYLGAGLNGSVHGKRSKIKKLALGKFDIKSPKVAFPDLLAITSMKSYEDRNGSIGGEILKRFNCVFDYSNSKLMLKPNRYFNQEFSYNKSGILLENSEVRIVMELSANQNSAVSFSGKNTVNINGVVKPNYKYNLKPVYTIYQVLSNSPAEKAGLIKGDEIIYINNRNTQDMTLEKVISYFFEDSGEELKIIVNRNGIERKFRLILKSPLE